MAAQWRFLPEACSGGSSLPIQRPPRRLAARWLFLRALGLIFFSAFYSLVRQVLGLIGPDGLLPVSEYLQAVRQVQSGASRFWDAPTLFWLGSGSRALLLLAWLGLIASILLILNLWPRGMIFVCLAAFLSFITALQTFSSYQSDGMLLSVGFIGLFFAPPGFRPGWGERHPPSRASWFLLLLVWFTIYFESGVAKIASGDPEWRNFTAMDDYYQNGPLPTWIAWHAQHLPHWFHAGTAAFTLGLELVLIWMALLPRPFRIALFWIILPLQIGIIVTSNYAFLNYLVLALGILLLDDAYLARFLPLRLRPRQTISASGSDSAPPTNRILDESKLRRQRLGARAKSDFAARPYGFSLLFDLGLLRHRGAGRVDDPSRTASSGVPGCGPRAFSNRQSIWAFRGDDSGTIRDRIPRLE